LVSPTSSAKIRRKTPQIIFAAIAIAFAVYVVFEILADILIVGGSGDPLINFIVSFIRNVTPIVSSWSYTGVFGLMLLESSSIPIPSEVILPFAGFLVSKGQLNIWLTIAVATVAGVAGAFIDYYIGLKGANALAKNKILGRVLFSTAQLDYASKWFTRYGAVMVFGARLIPGFRTLVSFPAGAVKMSLVKFAVLTAAGCLIWNSVLVYVGYYLGSKWSEVAGILHYLIIAAFAAGVAVIVVYMVIKRRRKHSPTNYIS
jgi:membrane protein DedA with SNARE-associated domain